MKTLITGASGFVGAAVLRRLLEDGREVRAFLRPSSPRKNLQGLAWEPAWGDLRDRASLRKACRGCDTLFHVAADYRLWVPDPGPLHATNVTGTSLLMEEALRAGIGRIVYTSSVATIGLSAKGTPSDESTPSVLKDMVGHYKASKFLAEGVVRYMVRRDGLPAVIVNPSTPLGPRDIKPTPTGRTILEAARGRMRAYVDTGLNIVHVQDVAEGHLLALRHGKEGERYILGGRDMTLKEILTVVARVMGNPPPVVRLPRAPLFPLAWVVEVFSRLTGASEPLLTVDGLRMAGKRMFFSSRKAEVELGYAPGPAERAIEDAVAWFCDNGYVKRRGG